MNASWITKNTVFVFWGHIFSWYLSYFIEMYLIYDKVWLCINLLSHVSFSHVLIFKFSELSTSHLTTLWCIIDSTHYMIRGFKIFHETILESWFLCSTKLITGMTSVQCFFLANWDHLSGHCDLGFHSDSFHFKLLWILKI